MVTIMVVLMIMLLLLGFPMMVPLLAAAIFGLLFLTPIPMTPNPTLIQQMIGGVKPAALIAVPMFIFAADIVTKGHAAVWL